MSQHPKKISQSALVWLWISALVIILDQFTKYLVVKYLPLGQPIAVFPFFNLTHWYNTGAAFSFLGYSGKWTSWLFGTFAVIVSVFIFVWLRRIAKTQYWIAIALTLILGGALGNLIDRIHYGYVIDFIQVYYRNWYWPTFNVADSAISVGAIMLAIAALRDKK